jgi:iron(II)-dependent oxidoreductase
MALVPEGIVDVEGWHGDETADDLNSRLVRVEAIYLDRYAVSNQDYEQFVAAGGYEDMALWDEEIWPGVLDFVDRTEEPGPRFWAQGRCPAGKERHPVVGVSWYEAAAFARWVGKRLPSDPEWVKAATWPIPAGEARPTQRKFPWGDSPDCSLANLWASGIGDTAPVDSYPGGASVGQALQLVGNVWEWTGNNFISWNSSASRLELPKALKSIRGGAFDTYFTNHAACQFQSGENPLARKHNVGFRCAVSARDLWTTWGQEANRKPLLDGATEPVPARE